MKISCLYFGKGAKHDFSLYKNSRLRIPKTIKQLTDLGYMGIKKLHLTTKLPHKSSKKHKLDKEQKRQNRRLAKERVGNEHVMGKLKISKILFGPYRNRRKRFGLRFSLIAGIYNAELDLKAAA
jgi:hypothetical protein